MKAKEPFVFSNLAISIDGKIATQGREFFTIGSAADLRLLRKLRDRADVILFGAEVLRVFQKACLPLDPDAEITNAVLSRNLKGIDPNWPFFKSPRIRRILYVTGKVSAARLAEFRKTSEVVQIPAPNPARAILADLRKRKAKRVGVEGGGAIMWEFVKSNLIDEYYLTIVPRILGGGLAPTLVDGTGFKFSEVLNLRLKSIRKKGSELFLVYTPLGTRGHKHPLFK